MAIQLTTTPLLVRKPCKLFAGVAWVCQRQLGFLVLIATWITVWIQEFFKGFLFTIVISIYGQE